MARVMVPETTEAVLAQRVEPASQAEGRSELPRPRKPPVPSRTDSELLLLEPGDSAESYVMGWERLAGEAIEPNPFFEPWMLRPALRHYADESVRLALLIKHQGGGAKPIVFGALPLRFSRRVRGLPFPRVRSWKHAHCYLANPLIARGYESEFWEVLFRGLQNSRVAGPLLELPTLSGDGPVLQSLLAYAFARGVPLHIRELYSRALLRLGPGTGEDYVKASMGGDHRRGYARKKRQLSEKGKLEVCEFRPGDSYEAWHSDFLRVEASGWKGQAATAIACHPRDRDYFEQTTREAARRNRLMLMSLKLDGRAIAVHYGIHAGEGSFAVKIGYDETLGQYSPGMLLEIEAIHALHRDRPCQWVDCCSACGSVVMQRVWKQERLITSVVCPTGHRGGRLIVSALPMIRYLRRRLHLARKPPLPADTAH